jgi:hypothetical protein
MADLIRAMPFAFTMIRRRHIADTAGLPWRGAKLAVPVEGPVARRSPLKESPIGIRVPIRHPAFHGTFSGPAAPYEWLLTGLPRPENIAPPATSLPYGAADTGALSGCSASMHSPNE